MKPERLNYCRHVLAAWALGAKVRAPQFLQHGTPWASSSISGSQPPVPFLQCCRLRGLKRGPNVSHCSVMSDSHCSLGHKDVFQPALLSMQMQVPTRYTLCGCRLASPLGPMVCAQGGPRAA
jgi:hypothetical protein